jgi:hypothetical protein
VATVPTPARFTHTEPVIFPGDQRPSVSSLTHVYIHGRGGYYKTPVVGQNYDFDVPLPLRPAQPSTLRTTILSLPFGGPSPTLALVPNSDPPRMHVTYPLAGVSDPTNTARFGAVIAATWQTSAPNPNEATSRLLRVTFDSIKINNDHDPVFSGEWRLWLRAGGEWFEVSGLGDVDDGDTVNINRSIELIVPDNGDLEIQTSGWENDCDNRFRRRDADIKLWDLSLGDVKCEANGNDNIGVLERRFQKSDGYGIGSHDDPSLANGDDGDTLQDFNLRYRVEQVKVFEPAGNTTGNLQVTMGDSDPHSNPAFPVQVTGPGFSQGLNHTVTLTGLAPGVYTINASEFFTGQGTRNCRLFSPFTDTAQVTVTAGQTANISVEYSSAGCNA